MKELTGEVAVIDTPNPPRDPLQVSKYWGILTRLDL